jgi:hypothetical protein
MNLSELAFACYVYAGMSDYDISYNRLRTETSPQVDLAISNHRGALLKWLNDWGCRQFSKNHHDSASAEIGSWYSIFSPRLFPPQRTLSILTRQDLGTVEEAFGDLMHRTASMRETRNGQISPIEIGPTGAAKILFALRPEALVPWDSAIRSNHNLDGSARSYLAFLEIVKNHLSELEVECQRFEINLHELPAYIERPQSSLAKLVDEYFWVTITRRCAPPSNSWLMRWPEWACPNMTLQRILRTAELAVSCTKEKRWIQ